MNEPARGLAVFARTASRPIPRVIRMMDVAKDLGYETIFLSARREEGLPESDASGRHTINRIGRYFPLVNGQALFTYVFGILNFNLALLGELRRRRPTLVHCSDVETMPATILYRTFARCRLIYNIHDNLSERYALPAIARYILNVIEGLLVLCASVALVPEKFRRTSLPTWCRRKVHVIRNTPEDKGVAAIPDTSRPIRILYGGWLDPGRGLYQLLDLVGGSEDFELTVAGEGTPDIVRKINETPRTRYLGFVGHEEIMEETANCHFVAALYSPHRLINRYAASNKLAESLSCGRPPIVSSEMMIVKDLAPYDCIVSLPYEQVPQDAANMLRDLIGRDERPSDAYQAKCASARRAYEELYSWSLAQASMRKAILGEQSNEDPDQ